MNIEMDENSAIALTICTLALCVVVAALGGCHLTEQTNQKAIEAGLVQKEVPGSTGLKWQKP